jgi:hypothetical protein
MRWARFRGIDLVLPVAIVLAVASIAPQLGFELVGVPALALWAVATAAVVMLSRPFRGSAPASDGAGGPTWPATTGAVLIAGVIVAWVLYDIWFWGQTTQLYDLDVYLGSAARWLSGGQPYMSAPVTRWPSSAAADFFLYPPPLLPLFGALSRLPHDVVSAGWVAGMMACAYWSFRIVGLPRKWALALLAFPPVAIGFESGNVASLTFLLFAASFRYGGNLMVAGLFKIQAAIPALWLIRTRRWRGLLAGVAAVALIALITLPIVGIDSWRAWWQGLGYRAASQPGLPSLYGYSMAQLPTSTFAVSVAVMTLCALLFRGRRGLAALGLVSIFASPSLWPHGFVFALPALLMLENGAVVWLLLGAGAFGLNMWLLVGAGWIAVAAAARRPAGRLQPLAGRGGPWPEPPWRVAAPRRAPAGSGFDPSREPRHASELPSVAMMDRVDARGQRDLGTE